MVAFFDICTVAVETIVLVRIVPRLGESCRNIFFLLFFVIAVLPLALDYAVGFPDYYSWATGSRSLGFIVSEHDAYCRLCYDFYLLVFTAILLIGKSSPHQRKKQITASIDKQLSGRKGQLLLAGAALLPLVLVIMLPVPNQILYSWGWRDAGLYPMDANPYYSSIEKLSYIGLTASVLLLLGKNVDGGYDIARLFWMVPLAANTCIESKRSILMFLAVVILCYLAFSTNRKTMRKVLVVGFVVGIVLIAFSVYVKLHYRGYSDMAAVYASLRIDFFRDDTVKMSLYPLFYDGDFAILSFPFESYIMQLGYLFPLDFLRVPRCGYNTYLTCAMLGLSPDAGFNYMTTSMLDEAIANFGFFGIVVSPIFSRCLANYADKQGPTMKTLLSASFVLLLMYSPNYIMWFLEFVLIFALYNSFTKQSIKHESN